MAYQAVLAQVKQVFPGKPFRFQHCAAACLQYLKNQHRWQTRRRNTWQWVRITIANLTQKLEQYGEKLVSSCLKALMETGLIQRQHIPGRAGKCWEYLPNLQNGGFKEPGSGFKEPGSGFKEPGSGFAIAETVTETEFEAGAGENQHSSQNYSSQQEGFADCLKKGEVGIEQVPPMTVVTESGERDLLEAVLSEKEGQPGVAGRQHAINIYRKHPDRLAGDIVLALQKSEALVSDAQVEAAVRWFDLAKAYCKEIVAMSEGFVFVDSNKSNDAVCLGNVESLRLLSFERLSSLISEVCYG